MWGTRCSCQCISCWKIFLVDLRAVEVRTDARALNVPACRALFSRWMVSRFRACILS